MGSIPVWGSGRSLIHRRPHLAEAVPESEQAFGMAHKEVASGRKLVEQPVDKGLPRRLIEVDHHVAAEDHILRVG